MRGHQHAPLRRFTLSPLDLLSIARRLSDDYCLLSDAALHCPPRRTATHPCAALLGSAGLLVLACACVWIVSPASPILLGMRATPRLRSRASSPLVQRRVGVCNRGSRGSRGSGAGVCHATPAYASYYLQRIMRLLLRPQAHSSVCRVASLAAEQQQRKKQWQSSRASIVSQQQR